MLASHEPIGRKVLGQHWLNDSEALDSIVAAAELAPDDVVLEIGPGTGNLTSKLLAQGVQVIAVEKDEKLAAAFPKQPGLSVVAGDILKYDLTQMPPGYKVVANIPYYLTSKLLRLLNESTNPPEKTILLIQKEVAERVCAEPGRMSLLSVSAQLFNECRLGRIIPASSFSPPPKVDSQVVILDRRSGPLFKSLDEKKLFKLARAGFSERRKKLRSALAGGLGIDKDQADKLLADAGIDGNRRAQELSLSDWAELAKNY